MLAHVTFEYHIVSFITSLYSSILLFYIQKLFTRRQLLLEVIGAINIRRPISFMSFLFMFLLCCPFSITSCFVAFLP